MYEYQKNNKYFAQVTGGTEELCAQELLELGAVNTNLAYRGVYFEADLLTLYKINYTSRLLTRVLAPLVSFHCRTPQMITKAAEKISWENFLSVNETFAITASVAKSSINNSLYAAQVLKDGIADYFRDKYNRRPDVNTENPTVRFNLFIEKDNAIISIDTSGESLHKRGYRLLAGEAPMQETLAAAIIRISGWKGEKPLWDPMCGSGTILCEALMHYCNIPTQYLRKNFGFFHMPGYIKNEWLKLKEEIDSKIRPLPDGLISGTDKSQRVIKVAEENASRLPFGDKIKLSGQPFQHVKGFENGMLITNPPYGIRLGNLEDVQELYKELGDYIKQKCHGTTAYIYTGDPSLRKHIGLKTSRRIPLVNGNLEGVLLQIDSYEGTKKKQWQDDSEQNTNPIRRPSNIDKKAPRIE